MRQDEIKRHQTGLDGLGLVLTAMAAVFVPDSSIERPEAQVEHLSVVGEDLPAAMAAIEQIGEEVLAPLAALGYFEGD
jgi:hypothetical protein